MECSCGYQLFELVALLRIFPLHLQYWWRGPPADGKLVPSVEGAHRIGSLILLVSYTFSKELSAVSFITILWTRDFPKATHGSGRI